jgi:hypothetical protein
MPMGDEKAQHVKFEDWVNGTIRIQYDVFDAENTDESGTFIRIGNR